MRQSESIAELAKALAAAQAEFRPIPKTADNPFYRSKYADLASIVEATAPILSKHGLAVAQFPSYATVTGTEELVTILMHSSGEFVCSAMLLRMKDLTAQGQGSAISYCRRYAYSAAVGIVTEEDDDGNAASRPGAQAQATEQYQRRTQQLAPPVQASIDGEIIPEEDMEARRQRIIAEAKARGPLEEKVDRAQAAQQRTRPSPMRPMP